MQQSKTLFEKAPADCNAYLAEFEPEGKDSNTDVTPGGQGEVEP